MNVRLQPGDVDLFDPESYVRGLPYDYFAVLRREAPVHWQPPPPPERAHDGLGVPITEGFWAITKYDDVAHISRTPEIFSSSLGSSNLHDAPPDLLAQYREIMINMDPPRHARFRRLVSGAFTPRAISTLEASIRAHAQQVVDGIVGRGECEFVTDVARELPLVLICELLGFPVEDRHRVFEWSNRMIGGDDSEYVSDPADREQASVEFYVYNAEASEQKRARPDETLLSALVNGEVDGESLTPHEVNSFVLLLAVAGNETTRNATSHGVRLLSEHPDQAALLATDVERYLSGFVEEVLRFSPSVIHFRRTTTEATEIRGVRLAAGAKVAIFYPSANRDEEIFDNSDSFDITRDPNPHLAFGFGQHFCLGASLARMQLRSIFREVVGRLPELQLAAPPRRLRSNFIHGIKEMRVGYAT